MTQERKPDLSKVEPVGGWPDTDESRDEPGARAEVGGGLEPIPGTPAAVPPAEELAGHEPEGSPETERELDRLRRE